MIVLALQSFLTTYSRHISLAIDLTKLNANHAFNTLATRSEPVISHLYYHLQTRICLHPRAT